MQRDLGSSVGMKGVRVEAVKGAGKGGTFRLHTVMQYLSHLLCPLHIHTLRSHLRRSTTRVNPGIMSNLSDSLPGGEGTGSTV